MKIKRKSKNKKRAIILSVVLALIFSSGAFAWLSQSQQNNDDRSATKTDTKKAKSQKETKEQSASEDNTKAPSNDIAQPSSTFTPTKPTGTFVSNHNPNLSGSPAPNQMSSTCQTTPGVYCTIQFTKGSIVKSLPSKKTDSSGNTSWDWKLQDVGLTAGEWSIEAIAKNGDKVSRAQDSMNLRIDR